MNGILTFDFAVLDFIQEHIRCGFLDVFMTIVTKFGDGGIFWICVALVLIAVPKTRKTGFMVGAALLMGLIVGNLTLKPLIARIRPYDLREIGELLVTKPSDYSFPSGHTLASFEASIVLLIRDKRIGIPAFILAVLVAFSRLYLYVHYPTDVICGALLGTAFAFLAVLIVNAIYKAASRRKSKVQND